LDPPGRSPYWHDEQQLEAEAYAWFNDLFYDPEAERAAGITRKYRWLPQDTIAPYEVLQSRYGKTMSPWLIRDISERLSETSSNWRSRPDEFTDKNELASPQAATTRPNEIEVEREALLAAIAALEAAVAAIQNPKPLFGHNMPPEGLDDDPVSRKELADLVVTINQMKQQAKSPAPDTQAIIEGQGKLSKFAQTAMTWGGGRGTKFTDAMLETSGKALGAALVLKITGILPDVYAVIAAAAKFVGAITHSLTG
jgi:hypothetical protein